MSEQATATRGPRADASPTAGFLGTDWSPRDIPAGSSTRNVVLRTQDGAATTGTLYLPDRKSDTVVCIMHPREFMAAHYLVPDILEAGFAAWSQAPRSVGNDLRLEHEIALFGAGALAYGGLELIEGGGLFLRKRWAEWLTVIATTLLIPVELYELARRPSLWKAGGILVNVLIVVYLASALRRRLAAGSD